MLDFVRTYRDLGKTLIYSTHVMSEAEEVCDRVGFLYKGHLIYEGSIQEALQEGEGSFERAFIRKVQEVMA